MKRARKITPAMTIREAAEIWDDPQKTHLDHWVNGFNLPLREFHIGHVRTYQNERLGQSDTYAVDREVGALLDLLAEVDLDYKILGFYERLTKPVEPAKSLMRDLPMPVQYYIIDLKQTVELLLQDKRRLAQHIYKGRQNI